MRPVTNRLGTIVARKFKQFATQTRDIHYGSSVVEQMVKKARMQSPEVTKNFKKIELEEARNTKSSNALREKLTMKVASLPLEHDVHKLDYGKKFVNTRVELAAKPELKIKLSKGEAPSYNYRSHTVSFMTGSVDEIAHETKHAADSVTNKIKFERPQERLASEIRAFTSQNTAALEATQKPPAMFNGRTAYQMAKT
ncbi:MAG: hypothetical protein ACI9C4_000420, partial [Paraglaciecola sp.]